MRTRALAGILVALGVAGGCSDRPREIREAKPVKTDAADTPVELPKTPPPAASDPAAAAVLKAALAAHTGGKPELLDKLRSVSYTREGSTLSPPMTPMTWTIRGRWPDGYRADVDIPGQPRMSICRTGSSAWQHYNVVGMTKQVLSGDPVKGVLADGTYESLAVLAPLADPDLIAAPAPDRTVMDKPATGVWLTGKNLPSVVAHFDKETQRLAQFTYSGSEVGKPVVKEVIVTESGPEGGVTLPRKLLIKWDGRPAVEWAVTKFEFPADLPAKVFEEP